MSDKKTKKNVPSPVFDKKTDGKSVKDLSDDELNKIAGGGNCDSICSYINGNCICPDPDDTDDSGGGC